MTTTPAARVCAVLVNFRSLEDVAARLASEALAGQRVIVVDNASDPEAIRALCRLHGATEVLLPTNAGFAAGVNAAWEVARKGPPLPLLLLNPDAELTRQALEDLLDALASPGTTAVAPVLVEPSGRLQVGAAGGPVTLRSVVAYFLGGAHLLPSWRGLFLTRRQCLRADRVDWLCMACLLLAPDALERFGPVPEDELVYAEDVAWGTSATRAGGVLRLVPAVRVVHAQGSSGGSSQWTGSLERLLRRRLGGVRGSFAVLALRTGLAARRLVRGLSRSAPAGSATSHAVPHHQP